MKTIFYIEQYGSFKDVEEKDYLVQLSVGDEFVYEELSYKITEVKFCISSDTLRIYSDKRL